MKAVTPYYMSFKEMKEKYPDNWILVANPKSKPASAEVTGGYFLFNAKDKQRVLNQAKKIKVNANFTVKSLRILYTGQIKLNENQVVCL